MVKQSILNYNNIVKKDIFRKKITIKILNNDKYEKEVIFYVELGQPVWHNKQNNLSINNVDGYPILSNCYRCCVTITEDQVFKVKKQFFFFN